MAKRMTSVHITRRTFLKGVGLVAAGSGMALAGCSPTARTGSSASGTGQAAPLLAIIHTNDTHGHDDEVASADNAQGNFSMAAIPKLKADWEARGYEVLVLDVGDATQGMPLVDQSNGETGITFMNACGYMAMAVGNHEFDRGPDELAKYEELAGFPLLSANVIDAQTGQLRFKPNTIIELASGIKVGLFGLTTPSTVTTVKPDLVAGFRFLGGNDLYACAQKQVDELRGAGADLVVCMGHLGNDQSAEPSRSTDVLNNVSGIDLFLDGHDHQLVEQEVAGTLLVETDCYLHNIGLVVVDDGTAANESIKYGSYSGTDASAQAVIDNENTKVDGELAVVLGHVSFLLDGSRDPGLRTQETNLGDFCTDAWLWAAGKSSGTTPDAAIINGGAMRSSIGEGDITLHVIKSVFAFSNQTLILKLTGAQLPEALEAGYQSVGIEAIGAFPQVAGIELTVNAAVPYEKGEIYPNSTFYAPAKPGARVTINTVGGRAWSADEIYSVVTSDFLCLGGDTYYAFKQAANAERPTTCDFDYEAFVGYLTVACNHEVPDTYAKPQGRISVIGSS